MSYTRRQVNERDRSDQEREHVSGERSSTGATVPGEFIVRSGEGRGGPLILSVLEVTGGFNRFQIADSLLILAENEIAGSSGSVVIDAKDPEDVRSVGMFEAPNDWQFHSRYPLEGNVLVITRYAFGHFLLDVLP